MAATPLALPIFAITLFVSAFLLFLVQPMIGKMILPSLGGTPQVWNTCQMFLAGHRIRLEVSSSAFPKYPRNLNTGEALGKSSRMLTAQQRIYHDEKHPSHVILPIVPLGR